MVHQYLLLDQRHVGQDEDTVLLPADHLSEDEDLGHQGLPSAGGQRVDEVPPVLHALEAQTRLLPVWKHKKHTNQLN